MKKLSQIFIIILFFYDLNSQAQSYKMPYTAGFYGSGNLNFHQPNTISFSSSQFFAGQPAVFDEDKMLFSFAGGVILNIPWSGNLSISARLGYNDLSDEFKKDIKPLNAADTSLTNALAFDLSYIEISPIVQFHRLIKNAYFLTGIEIGIPVNNKYTLHQLNISPSLEGGGRVRDIETDVEIPKINNRVAFIAGIGYVFSFNNLLFIEPEFSYRYPFNDVSTEEPFAEWFIPQVRLGVNILFGFKVR
jgi:hypothetical protein